MNQSGRASALSPLSCTCRESPDGETVLHLDGEIDLSSVGLLEAWLRAARELEQPIVLDLEDVTFLDSAGLHVLVLARREGPLSVRRARLGVARCLEVSGVAAYLADTAHAEDVAQRQPA